MEPNLSIDCQYDKLKRGIAYFSSRIKRTRQTCLGSDDLFNVGVIGLIRAISRFDVNGKASFETFAKYHIQWAMLDEVRSMRFLKTRNVPDANLESCDFRDLPCDVSGAWFIHGEQGQEGHAIESKTRDIIGEAIGCLNYSGRVVISLYYLQEHTLNYIGHVLGVSESRVSQIRKKSLIELRQLFKHPLGDYIL